MRCVWREEDASKVSNNNVENNVYSICDERIRFFKQLIAGVLLRFGGNCIEPHKKAPKCKNSFCTNCFQARATILHKNRCKLFCLFAHTPKPNYKRTNPFRIAYNDNLRLFYYYFYSRLQFSLFVFFAISWGKMSHTFFHLMRMEIGVLMVLVIILCKHNKM